MLDSTGTRIRTLSVPTRAGMNRATWDLRYEPPPPVVLRTIALQNPFIWNEPRYRNQTTRTISHWGIQQPQGQGPLGVPGRYSVRLRTDSNAAPSAPQPFRVVLDTTVTRSAADLTASLRAQLRLRTALDTAVAMINRLEVMRKQIEDQRKTNAGKADLLAALDTLDRRILDVELRLVTESDLNSDDKYFVEKYRIYMNLIWLAGEIGTGAGDVAGGADYRPTDQALATLSDIERELAAAKAAYAKLLRDDVPAFNRRMAGKIIMD